MSAVAFPSIEVPCALFNCTLNETLPVSGSLVSSRGWLSGEYRAVIYEDGGEVVAYALFREQAEEIYLQQLFVVLVVPPLEPAQQAWHREFSMTPISHAARDKSPKTV